MARVASSYLGCLDGHFGLGRALAAGTRNPDDDSDFGVSDDLNVNVIDGNARLALLETDSRERRFSSLTAGALLGSSVERRHHRLRDVQVRRGRGRRGSGRRAHRGRAENDGAQ
jgi:hypothetical protein